MRTLAGYRSEAKGVPHVLVARKEAKEARGDAAAAADDDEEGDDGRDGIGGYYEDGAFIAAPISTSNIAPLTGLALDAQEAYYTSLMSRFKELCVLLQQTPPLAATQALTAEDLVSFPSDSPTAREHWRHLIHSREPRMAQLACMDMETVLEVVNLLKSLLAGTVRSRNQEKIQRLGAWVWGILGRCNESGLLGKEEISELRELGKRAVGLLTGIRDRSGKAYGHEEQEDEPVIADGQENQGGEKGEKSFGSLVETVANSRSSVLVMADTEAPTTTALESQALQHAKVLLQESLGTDNKPQSDGIMREQGEVAEDRIGKGMKMSVNKQIRVMLDMIITVVGESYGQRDLLEFREMWEDEQGGTPT